MVCFSRIEREGFEGFELVSFLGYPGSGARFSVVETLLFEDPVPRSAPEVPSGLQGIVGRAPSAEKETVRQKHPGVLRKFKPITSLLHGVHGFREGAVCCISTRVYPCLQAGPNVGEGASRM